MKYYAHYWRYYSEYKDEHDTIEDAIDFLENGEDYGLLSAVDILDEDDNVLVNEQQVYNHYVFGNFEGQTGEVSD